MTTSQQPRISSPSLEEGYLTLRHASLFLDMPIGTLRKRYMAGQIKFIQDPYSKRIYFSKRELIRYMQRGEQKSIVARIPLVDMGRRIRTNTS